MCILFFYRIEICVELNICSSIIVWFKNNISGECEIDLLCRNDVISYTKLLDNKKFTNTNVNRYLRNIFHYELEDFEVCISINKNFENSGYYDKILQIKEDFLL